MTVRRAPLPKCDWGRVYHDWKVDRETGRRRCRTCGLKQQGKPSSVLIDGKPASWRWQ